MPEMEAIEILKVLPHRYPMILVDRVVEYQIEERRIVGIKNLTINEDFFQGHFPGEPLMPGVLQLEAMAQLGGILLNKILGTEAQISYFTGINKARFRRMVRPGDQLRMEVVIQRMRLGSAKVQGKAFVDDEFASEAEMTFRLRDA